MNGNGFKRLIDGLTGYWVYRSRYLPIGADLRIDVTVRAGHRNVHTIFDVGANRGQTYRTFRRDFPQAEIYSFEPVTESFEILSSSLRGDRKARAGQIAFGAKEGEKAIRLFDGATELNSLRDDLMNSASDAKSETVRIDTIDGYCSRHAINTIDLLKIDTEGYEIPVLEGACSQLEAGNIAFILCEVGFTRSNTRNTYFADLTEFLASRRYSFFGLYDISHYWADGVSFGNALFVHESVVTAGRVHSPG